MKHWFFAFVVAIFLAWMAADQRWFDTRQDPVERRTEAQAALQSAEELVSLYREHRELLIRIETLSEASVPGVGLASARASAVEWVDGQIEWHENQVRWLRMELNQVP